MKIRKLERVELRANPLREVIAQISFPRDLQIDRDIPVAFQKAISAKFPIFELLQNHELMLKVSNEKEAPTSIENQKAIAIYQFRSLNNKDKISLSNNFISYATKSYENWDKFIDAFQNAYNEFQRIYNIPLITRVGLRYRNLIDRSDLFKNETVPSWSQLISPAAIGHIATEGMFENNEPADAVLKNIYSISQLKLESYSLNIQTGFADKNGVTCFFIDNDFFNNLAIKVSDFKLKERMEVLHADSESTFRHLISRRLFDKLKY